MFSIAAHTLDNTIGKLDMNLQFAGDPVCGVNCEIMHTIRVLNYLATRGI